MMRVFGYWLGLLACCCLPGLALAQTTDGGSPISTPSSGPIPVQVLSLDHGEFSETRPIPISKAQCDADVEITFRLNGLDQLPSGAMFLQLWQGTDCYKASQRDDEAAGTDCTELPVPDNWTFADITQSFQDDFTTSVKSICDRGNGVFDLFFLPAANTTDNAEMPVYGKFRIEVDQAAPRPMSNLVAGAGETSIKITWTVGDTNDTANTLLIWDKNSTLSGDAATSDGGTSGGGSTNCSSGILMEGEDTDLNALMQVDSIETEEIPGTVASATLTGSRIGADYAAMVVVARDLAGNLSKMSNVDCIEVVDTSGFWDAYREGGGNADGGCGCSAPGTRRSFGSTLWPFALGLLAWVALRRTRKGARS